MKNWKHLTFEQRKVISSGISHKYKLKNIGESLLVDPTSVSKEVKRNRIEVSIGLKNNCNRTQRWPYVCTGCKNRYNNCPYTKYKYDALKAQQQADINLLNSSLRYSSFTFFIMYHIIRSTKEQNTNN